MDINFIPFQVWEEADPRSLVFFLYLSYLSFQDPSLYQLPPLYLQMNEKWLAGLGQILKLFVSKNLLSNLQLGWTVWYLAEHLSSQVGVSASAWTGWVCCSVAGDQVLMHRAPPDHSSNPLSNLPLHQDMCVCLPVCPADASLWLQPLGFSEDPLPVLVRVSCPRDMEAVAFELNEVPGLVCPSFFLDVCSLSTDCPPVCLTVCSLTTICLSVCHPSTVFLFFCQSAAGCVCQQSTVCPWVCWDVCSLSSTFQDFVPLQRFFPEAYHQSIVSLLRSAVPPATACLPAAPLLSSVCRQPSICLCPLAVQTQHRLQISDETKTKSTNH